MLMPMTITTLMVRLPSDKPYRLSLRIQQGGRVVHFQALASYSGKVQMSHDAFAAGIDDIRIAQLCAQGERADVRYEKLVAR